MFSIMVQTATRPQDWGQTVKFFVLIRTISFFDTYHREIPRNQINYMSKVTFQVLMYSIIIYVPMCVAVRTSLRKLCKGFYCKIAQSENNRAQYQVVTFSFIAVSYIMGPTPMILQMPSSFKVTFVTRQRHRSRFCRVMVPVLLILALGVKSSQLLRLGKVYRNMGLKELPTFTTSSFSAGGTTSEIGFAIQPFAGTSVLQGEDMSLCSKSVMKSY